MRPGVLIRLSSDDIVACALNSHSCCCINVITIVVVVVLFDFIVNLRVISGSSVHRLSRSVGLFCFFLDSVSLSIALAQFFLFYSY